MISPDSFVDILDKQGIELVVGVPDSLLKEVCACIADRFPPDRHIIAANEGAAIGIAIGHYLASSRPALVYMQNSGLGNAFNPIVSLASNEIYGIPMILLIGWRGEILNKDLQIADEPQHKKQGRVTLPLIKLLGVPFEVIDSNTNDAGSVLSELVDVSISKSSPVAMVVRKETFTPYLKSIRRENDGLKREEVVRKLIDIVPSSIPIVSTTGLASRELFAARRSALQKDDTDFLVVGGMGHASSIATGISNRISSKKVICIDGDGAMLMHMGALVTSAKSKNLIHIVINNGVHDSVGGQQISSSTLDLARIASDVGYEHTAKVHCLEKFAETVALLLKSEGSSFIEVITVPGSRKDLARPEGALSNRRKAFMLQLGNGK
jgi:phosphonopyruvate decarboxylase